MKKTVLLLLSMLLLFACNTPENTVSEISDNTFMTSSSDIEVVENGEEFIHLGYPFTGISYVNNKQIAVIMRNDTLYQIRIIDLLNKTVTAQYAYEVSGQASYIQYINNKLIVLQKELNLIELRDMDFALEKTLDFPMEITQTYGGIIMNDTLTVAADFGIGNKFTIYSLDNNAVQQKQITGLSINHALFIDDEWIVARYLKQDGHSSEIVIFSSDATVPNDAIYFTQIGSGPMEINDGALLWSGMYGAGIQDHSNASAYMRADCHRVSVVAGVPVIEFVKAPEGYEDAHIICGANSDFLAYAKTDYAPGICEIMVVDKHQEAVFSAAISVDTPWVLFDNAQLSPDGESIVSFDRLNNLIYIDMVNGLIETLEMS